MGMAGWEGDPEGAGWEDYARSLPDAGPYNSKPKMGETGPRARDDNNPYGYPKDYVPEEYPAEPERPWEMGMGGILGLALSIPARKKYQKEMAEYRRKSMAIAREEDIHRSAYKAAYDRDVQARLDRAEQSREATLEETRRHNEAIESPDYLGQRYGRRPAGTRFGVLNDPNATPEAKRAAQAESDAYRGRLNRTGTGTGRAPAAPKHYPDIWADAMEMATFPDEDSSTGESVDREQAEELYRDMVVKKGLRPDWTQEAGATGAAHPMFQSKVDGLLYRKTGNGWEKQVKGKWIAAK